MSLIRITMRGTYPANNANWMTFWWRSPTAPDVPSESMQTLADYWQSHITAFLEAQVAVAWEIDVYSGLYYPTDTIGSAPYPEVIDGLTTPINGEANAPYAEPRKTMLQSFTAFALTGPVRKRVYCGAYTLGGHASDGGPNSSIVLANQAVGEELLVPVVDGLLTWSPVVVSLQTGTQLVSAYNTLTNVVVRSRWAYLSSRDVGHGI